MTVDTEVLEVGVRDRQLAIVFPAVIRKFNFDAGEDPVAGETKDPK